MVAIRSKRRIVMAAVRGHDVACALVKRFELDDRGAVIAADPERHRRG